MEADEIRATVLEARRACAEAQSRCRDGGADSGIKALTDMLARLADAVESMLAERETFAGRLRRTPVARSSEPATTTLSPDADAMGVPALSLSKGSKAPAQSIIPSPAPDA